MPEKALIDQVGWSHIWLAILTALWGGLLSYFFRVQQGMKHSWASIAVHMAMSGFAGLLCWLGCQQFGVAPPLTAVFTGLAGHMGAEFVKVIESALIAKVGKSAE